MPHPLPTLLGKPEVVGLIEQLSPFFIRGWAFNRSHPQAAVDLTLWVDGACVTWFRPQQLWPLLAQQLGLPESALGPVRFQLTMPVGVADGSVHHIEVRCAHTNKLLPVEGLAQVQWQEPNLHLTELPYAWWPVKALASPVTVEPQVSVVVLNRNGVEVLADLLQSWHQHNRSVATEWIVIDHASTDHSLVLLNDWQNRISLRVVALQQNQSFSASCNLGARMARTPLLLFLNNDLVWQHDALPVLLASLQDPAVGAVGMKLLKVLPRAGSSHQPWTEVQHLGVRFVPHVDGYWPEETTPLRYPLEQEWRSQDVPCVTGAALLCRAADFWAVGGFDEQYFYGFEDVAMCLAIRFKLGKRIISCNDAWALHRHGHTRLTGREAAVTRRLAHNAHVLAQQWGLWLKWHWWQDLWQGTRQLGDETLCIGIQTPALPPPYGVADVVAPELKPLAALARRIHQTWPHARLTLVRRTTAGYWIKDLHVLVVTDPALQPQELQHPRADLRMVAWMHGPIAPWVTSQSWWDWDLRLAASKKVWRALTQATQSLCHQGWAPHPVLGPWQDAGGLKQVRAVIRWPAGSKRWLNTVTCQIEQLRQAWAAAGITCRQQGPWPLSLPLSDHPSSAEGVVEVASVPSAHAHWVAEICVWLLPVPKYQNNSAWPVLEPGHLNVLWWQGGMPATGWPEPAVLAPDVIPPLWQTSLMPDSTTVLQALEIELGRPFSSP